MSNSISGPAYRIETERLIIRCWHPKDAQLLKDTVDKNLDHLQAWMPWAHHEPTSIQDKVNLLRTMRGEFDLGKDFVYGIFNQDQSTVLGGTGLHLRIGDNAREIGYWLHKDHTRQGLTTETVLALSKVAFEIDQVDRIEIHCDPANIGSASVAQKAGYYHEATLRNRTTSPNGQPRDTMIWSLFFDQYKDSPAASMKIKAFDATGQRLI
ncbi:MAG: GNAT family protein [Chloroflexota bacterium]